MKTIRPILLVALVALTGCFSLSREVPPVRFYVLGGTWPATGTPAGLTDAPASPLAGRSIGLRQLQLAEYLATPLLVVREGPHQITFSEFHQWGEDLDGGINRAVAGYLAAGAPFQSVNVAPWQPQAQYDFLIQLHLSCFEGVAPEGEAHLLAAWEIIRQRDGAVLARGTTDYRTPGWTVGDYDGLVALLDTGLGVLTNDLVASLGTLVAP